MELFRSVRPVGKTSCAQHPPRNHTLSARFAQKTQIGIEKYERTCNKKQIVCLVIVGYVCVHDVATNMFGFCSQINLCSRFWGCHKITPDV